MRRSRRFTALMLAAALPSSATGRPAPPEPSYAIVDVTVISMEGEGAAPHQTVVVRDGRIARVGPAAAVPRPAGARVIDGRGKFLVPGYVDMHVHVEAPEDLVLYLANGVTTVRNMRGRPEHVRWRRELETGARVGPALYTTGPFTNRPEIASVADAERAVAAQRRAGYDFVKVHGELSREALLALTAAARRAGIPVVGHPPMNLPYEIMLEARPATWEHTEDFAYVVWRPRGQDEATMRAAAEAVAAARVPVTPTLTVFDRVVGQVANLDSVVRRVGDTIRYVPPAQRARWTEAGNPYRRRFPPSAAPRLAERRVAIRAQTALLARAGVPLLVGTDAGDFPTLVPGFSYHEELRELASVGLTPAQVLRAATRDAAAALGRLDELGTVTAGKRAELVLLDGDPLADVANAARIAGVMRRGRWLPKGALDALLADLAARYARGAAPR